MNKIFYKIFLFEPVVKFIVLALLSCGSSLVLLVYCSDLFVCIFCLVSPRLAKHINIFNHVIRKLELVNA